MIIDVFCSFICSNIHTYLQIDNLLQANLVDFGQKR